MVAELAAAIRAGAALDFSRDPDRPVLRYPPDDEEASWRVHALLADDCRAELRQLLTTAAAYRRAAAAADPGAEQLLASQLGPTVAGAVRQTLPDDASMPMTHHDAFSKVSSRSARYNALWDSTRQTRHASADASSGVPPAPTAVTYWPDELPSLGPRTVDSFDKCACGTGSWARYGGRVLCLPCAKTIASRGKA